MSDRPAPHNTGDPSGVAPDPLDSDGLALDDLADDELRPGEVEARLRDLEEQLETLGHALRSPGVEPPTTSTSASGPRHDRRLDDLADRIHALAGEQQRLRSQFSQLLDRFETMSGDRQSSPSLDSQATTREPATLDERPFPQRLLALGKALVRRLRPAHPQRLVTLEPIVGPPANRLPTLGVALPPVEGEDEGDVSRIFGSQTHPPDSVLRSTSSGAFDLEAGDKLPELVLRPEPPSLPATPGQLPSTRPLPRALCELLRLLFASEDLDFAEIELGAGDRWRCDRPGGPRGRRLGKVLTWGGDATTAIPLTTQDRLAVGRYRHLGTVLPRRHVLRPLHALSPSVPRSEGPPATGAPSSGQGLVLRLRSLLGGGDRLVATLARSLGDRPLRVVLEAPSDPLAAARRRRLESRFPSLAILPLGDVLAAPVRDSAHGPIAARQGSPRSVDSTPWTTFAPQFLPSESEVAFSDVEGSALPVEPTTGWPWWVLEGSPPAANRQRLREWMGVLEDHLLIVHTGDLIPRHRPEDFVTLARTLADLPQCHFLMVGRGPLAGTVDDLARYAAHPRFRRVDSLDPTELWSAADLGCSLAPAGADLPSLLTALGAGCPVVARAEALAPALASATAGLVEPSGVDALAETIRQLVATPDRRSELARGARRLAEPFTGSTAEMAWHQRFGS